MGIKSLNTLIRNNTIKGEQKVHLSNFKGNIIAVDTNLYLYKFLYGNKNHINGIFFMINKLKKFGIIPIFVLDGKPPEEKNSKIKERKLSKNKLKFRVSELQKNLISDKLSENDILEIQHKIESIQKRILYVDQDVIDKTIQLFNLMGVAYIQADCEAEQYCAKLCRLNLVNAVISEDSDTIACGSKCVIRNFSNKDDYVLVNYLDEILYELEISYTTFIDLCILLGNDYNNRLKGYTIEQIFNMIKKYKTIDNLIINNLIYNLNFDYKSVYSILNLDFVKPDIVKLASQLNKKFDLENLEKFLKDFSDIDEKTFKHRLNLMFKINKPFILQKKKDNLRVYKIPHFTDKKNLINNQTLV